MKHLRETKDWFKVSLKWSRSELQEPFQSKNTQITIYLIFLLVCLKRKYQQWNGQEVHYKNHANRETPKLQFIWHCVSLPQKKISTKQLGCINKKQIARHHCPKEIVRTCPGNILRWMKTRRMVVPLRWKFQGVKVHGMRTTRQFSKG